MFKLNLEVESYLSNNKNGTLRKTLTRFRTSSHSLAIEYGRIQGIPRNERLCLCCNQNLVETEFNFQNVCKYAKCLCTCMVLFVLLVQLGRMLE